MYSQFLKNSALYLINFNKSIFVQTDRFIASLGLADWLQDAIVDSIHLLPLLFIVFFVIEIIEFFFADNISDSIKKFEHCAIIIGSFAAIVPQCGFSVIAATLYIKKYITKGAVIAIFLATSDEAIPVLLTDTQASSYVVSIILVKLVIAIVSGYLIDLILKDKKYIQEKIDCVHKDCNEEVGCCSHSVSKRRKRELFYHPLKHTLNVFVFILIITMILNYLFTKIDLASLFGNLGMFEVIIASIAGLIPNCSISVAIALMLIKGTITFGAAISGLLSNAGLGILVLLRHKETTKDTIFLISILLFISILSGIIMDSLHCF